MVAYSSVTSERAPVQAKVIQTPPQRFYSKAQISRGYSLTLYSSRREDNVIKIQ